jgi:hypothetical protein
VAYGYANLGTTELANLARDMPLVGANLIPRAPTLERWNTAAGGADATAAGFPTARLRDAGVEDETKPNAAQVAWYVQYNLGTTVDVDFVALPPGHEMGTDAITTLDIEFDQDQDAAFTGIDRCNLAASLPLADDSRLIQLDLKPTGTVTAVADAGGGDVRMTCTTHGMTVGEEIVTSGFVDPNYNGTFTVTAVAANTFDITTTWGANDSGSWVTTTAKRFSDVQHVRLAMGKGAGFQPQLTELVIGGRYQFPAWPEMPLNPDNLRNLAESSGPTKSGVIDKNTTAESGMVLDANWHLRNSEMADVRAWWKKMRGSFIWIWEPSSAPQSFHFMISEEDELEAPFVDWMQNKFHLAGVEQGPESKYLENE